MKRPFKGCWMASLSRQAGLGMGVLVLAAPVETQSLVNTSMMLSQVV